jgi:ribosome-binding ATPase
MSLSIGIVGLPNVGKSTLFKLLTKKAVEAANYPFCTIDPNVGIVKVPDQRLDKIAEISKPENIIPTTIEFIDIAGLVAGAHKGEGLGNKFLANIRECDAICEVIRDFKDEKVIHVNGQINPLADQETIEIELILADLNTILKRLDKTKREAKGNNKEIIWQLSLLEKLKDHLETGKPARQLELAEKELEFIKELHLLSLKPIIYVLNIDEGYSQKNKEGLAINIKLEEEISNLSETDQTEYRKSLDLPESGLDRLIRTAYKTLNLDTFFTTGPKETRAWTIQNGTKAPEAAGVIHTDFINGFIRAEVMRWEQLIQAGSELKAKELGKIRTEGKDYVVQDGDICHFLVNK